MTLTQVEFKLLCLLAREPTRVFGKQELLKGVWGRGAGCTSRTVEAHMCRLRSKLGKAGGGGLVVNHRGVGYALGLELAGEQSQAA